MAASVKAASDLDSKQLMMSLPEIVRLLKRKAKAEEEASEFVMFILIWITIMLAEIVLVTRYYSCFSGSSVLYHRLR